MNAFLLIIQWLGAIIVIWYGGYILLDLMARNQICCFYPEAGHYYAIMAGEQILGFISNFGEQGSMDFHTGKVDWKKPEKRTLMGIRWIGFPPNRRIKVTEISYTKVVDNSGKVKLESKTYKDLNSYMISYPYGVETDEFECIDLIAVQYRIKVTLRPANAWVTYGKKNWPIDLKARTLDVFRVFATTQKSDDAVKIDDNHLLDLLKKMNNPDNDISLMELVGQEVETIDILDAEMVGTGATKRRELLAAQEDARLKGLQDVQDAENRRLVQNIDNDTAIKKSLAELEVQRNLALADESRLKVVKEQGGERAVQIKIGIEALQETGITVLGGDVANMIGGATKV